MELSKIIDTLETYHAPVEAPCSALAVDTAEERLCPCTSGSTMLHAGDKQLRAASRSYQPQGAPELGVQPHCNASPLESHARGLRSGHAQAYATQPGPSDLVVARPSRAEPRRGQRYGDCLHVKGDS